MNKISDFDPNIFSCFFFVLVSSKFQNLITLPTLSVFILGQTVQIVQIVQILLTVQTVQIVQIVLTVLTVQIV